MALLCRHATEEDKEFVKYLKIKYGFNKTLTPTTDEERLKKF